MSKARRPGPRPAPAPGAPRPGAPAWRKKAAALAASPLAYPLVSLPLLLPCFWHSRIQAGDLSSHVYNVWLAQLVARGQAPGLAVVPQTTNILFDLMLSGLNGLFGMAAAQRIAVSLSVLAFAWGAFAFASAVAGRRAWSIFPAIAMLAYGWVFHMGFFNFYLSLGLCLWAMALVWAGNWGWNPRRAWVALPVMALAFVAHALPVAWAVALMAYRCVAGRVSPQRRLPLAGAAMAAMLVARVAMGRIIETRGGPAQLARATGADQLFVFDGKYLWVSAALLALWGVLLAGLLRGGARDLLAGAPFHFCLLTAAGIVIFPTWVAIPGYKHALAFIAERMSLPLAVCVCALVAGPGGTPEGPPEGPPRPRTWQIGALAAAALAFFGMLYRDEGVLNGFEDRLELVVAQLPAGRRVIDAVNDPGLRANAVTHMIDRVCVGRCYSYANYEPSTAQFRVRVTGANPIVAVTYADAYTMEAGTYVVKERDLPLYEVDLNAAGHLAIRGLRAGERCGSTAVDLL
ncbi:MAG: hypothetical protein ACLQU1_37890 [Bryobacteraceae bacterium]